METHPATTSTSTCLSRPAMTHNPPVEAQKASSAEIKPVQHGSDDYHWIGGGTSAKMTSGSAGHGDGDGKKKRAPKPTPKPKPKP